MKAPRTETHGLPELLSLRELAAYLGVPPSSVYYWRTQGKGPPGFQVGKQLRFRAADVDAWLQEQAARAGVSEGDGMTRLPDENLRALAARYCRILRAVEQAHILGDEDALISLLAGVDPVDLQSVAAELEAPAATTEQRGGTTLGFFDDGRVNSAQDRAPDVVAASPPVASEPAGSGGQPSAPAALDPYSRKVPCS